MRWENPVDKIFSSEGNSTKPIPTISQPKLLLTEKRCWFLKYGIFLPIVIWHYPQNTCWLCYIWCLQLPCGKKNLHTLQVQLQLFLSSVDPDWSWDTLFGRGKILSYGSFPTWKCIRPSSWRARLQNVFILLTFPRFNSLQTEHRVHNRCTVRCDSVMNRQLAAATSKSPHMLSAPPPHPPEAEPLSQW